MLNIKWRGRDGERKRIRYKRYTRQPRFPSKQSTRMDEWISDDTIDIKTPEGTIKLSLYQYSSSFVSRI